MSGQRTVSRARKRLRRTLRGDRHAPLAPVAGAPPCCPTLAPDVLAMYGRLVAVLDPLRIATVADGVALELCAGALGEYHRAAAVIAREGATYECRTEGGGMMHRARPEVQIAESAWKRGAAMLRDFGLTPASRPRVDPAPAPKPENPFEAIHREPARRAKPRRRTRPRKVGGFDV